MRTVENGAEILQQLAGALGVTDAKSLKQRGRGSAYNENQFKKENQQFEKTRKADLKLAKADLDKAGKISRDCDQILRAIANVVKDASSIKYKGGSAENVAEAKPRIFNMDALLPWAELVFKIRILLGPGEMTNNNAMSVKAKTSFNDVTSKSYW